jgi:hypothetical protein
MVQNSQTVGQHLKFLSLRKPFMLGKIGIKVFDHTPPQTLTPTPLGVYQGKCGRKPLYRFG